MRPRRRPARWALALGVLLALVPARADAHEGSFSAKYIDGSNLVLLTYNVHHPLAGLPTKVNLRLYDLVGAPVPFELARLTVLGEDGLLLDRPLPLEPTLDVNTEFAFPDIGDYVLNVEFTTGQTKVATATFPLQVGRVTPTASSGGGPLAPRTVLTFALGGAVALAGVAVSRRVRRPAPEPSETREPSSTVAS